MTANVQKIGIREFREHLPRYLLAALPVAITRHGETLGFYIPARHSSDEREVSALKQAALRLDKLLSSHGVTEEELFLEFKKLREGKES
ncbi:prevent-host-death protein [Gammaproteobacteria bacterium SCGC AG-212-F23]|nr:prevent-host-death protein [Gammaproteobacteria bacterium SCGC AG-212-F23]